MVLRSTAIAIMVSIVAPGKTNPINAENICRHIEILSSDAFEGREVATLGEKKTIEYLSEQFKEIGLQPLQDGTYLQKVNYARYTVIPPSIIKIEDGKNISELYHKKDFLVASTFREETIRIKKGDLVFAGFGIHAPEIGWDDYKDVDVKGKVVVVLSDVPGEYTADTTLWKGDPAANIYSKPFYKKNEAAKRGAIGLITLFKQSQQGLYTWESISNYIGVETLDIVRDQNTRQLKFTAVITEDALNKLSQNTQPSEIDFKKVALNENFKPFLLNSRIDFSFSNTWEDITTHNVIGILPGSDLADEAMVYSAHWDHVGIIPGAKGDSIRNGAVDNASGTAALIEIARAFKEAKNNRRSIVFLATGAEEVGLIGSIYYNQNPVFPIGKTVANFNMDAHYPYGKVSHITAVVYGRSELDPYLEESARKQNRILIPNTAQNIAANIFFRSDHFPFAEVGIPSEFAVGFGEAVGHDNQILQQKLAAYAYKYHQPGDEYSSDFNCDGIADDAEFIYTAGKLIDRDGAFPQWYTNQPFHKFRQNARFETAFFADKSASHIPQIATQGRSMDARPADIDMDGDVDLIVAGEYSYNIVLINNGQGIFSDETIGRIPLKKHDSEDIAIADFNGDGYPDLFIVSEDDLINEYYWNDGRGYFSEQSFRIPVEGKSNAVHTLDVNSDGHPDIIIGNDGENYCLLNDGKGGWINSPDRIPQNQKTTQDIEIGDINGDGFPDIICANEDDSEIWINNGNGYFTDETSSRIKITIGAWETREVDLGDIDRDGDLDLLMANVNFLQNKDAQNRLFLNDGNGIFIDVTTQSLPKEKMHSIDGDFIDFDGDGDLDIVTANGFGNGFEFYENDGFGKFQNSTAKVLSPSIRGDGIDVESADFNNDGIPDLYLCHFRGSDMLLTGKKLEK